MVELYCSLHAYSTIYGIDRVKVNTGNSQLEYSGEIVLYFTWIKPMKAISIADTDLYVVSCHLPIKSFLKTRER